MKLPKILVGIATKNDGKYLPRFLEQLDNLSFPKENLRFLFIFGESRDGTLEYIKEFCLKQKGKAKCEIYLEKKRWRPKGVSLKADLYEDMVNLIKDEEYILFIDSDVIGIPSNLLEVLIKLDKDIIAPYVYHENTNIFFDSYIFRKNGERFSPIEPIGEGTTELVEVDSVGTCLLVKSKIARQNSFANPHHWLHFCYFAREKGYKIFAVPFLRIEHIDCKDEPPHYSFEQQVTLGRVDIADCISRNAFSLEDLERFEKIIERKLH